MLEKNIKKEVPNNSDFLPGDIENALKPTVIRGCIYFNEEMAPYREEDRQKCPKLETVFEYLSSKYKSNTEAEILKLFNSLNQELVKTLDDFVKKFNKELDRCKGSGTENDWRALLDMYNEFMNGDDYSKIFGRG